MDSHGQNLFNKATNRLKRLGISDPTGQIVALEKEIDFYRDKIQTMTDKNKNYKNYRYEVVVKFAFYIIDKAVSNSVHISDMPDLVIDFLETEKEE